MIILDTNVISETIALRPHPRVVAWYRSISEDDIGTTAITVAELFTGICLMPIGKRRHNLSRAIDYQLLLLGNRILPFDAQAAIDYAEIRTMRSNNGKPISAQDAMIAAIARAHGAAVATRNVKDFEGTGVKLINPWEHED